MTYQATLEREGGGRERGDFQIQTRRSKRGREREFQIGTLRRERERERVDFRYSFTPLLPSKSTAFSCFIFFLYLKGVEEESRG
jgi:hypothetical protein